MRPSAAPAPAGEDLRERAHFLSPDLPAGVDSREAFLARRMLEAIAAETPARDTRSEAFREIPRVRELHAFLLDTGFLESGPLADWFIAVLVGHLRGGGSLSAQLDQFRRFLLRRRVVSGDGLLASHCALAAKLYPDLTGFFFSREARSRQLTELCLLCVFLEQDDDSADGRIARFLNPFRGNAFRRYVHATLLYALKDRAPGLFGPGFIGPLYATMLFLQQYFGRTSFFGENHEVFAAQAVTPDNDLGSRMTCLFDEIGSAASDRTVPPDILFSGVCAAFSRILRENPLSLANIRCGGEVFLSDVFARMLREELGSAAEGCFSNAG